MMLVLLVVLVGAVAALAVPAAPAQSASNELVWVCMFYHKSGTEFCKKILKRLSNTCDLNHGDDSETKAAKGNALEYYHNAEGSNKLLTDSHFISMRPTALADPWLKVFDSPNRVFKSILMVRDPFLLIMSSYKYHSQPVPPEPWLKGRDRDFCLNHSILERFEPLVRVQGGAEKVKEIYSRIDRLCMEVRAIFGKRSSYHNSLLALSKLNATTVNNFQKPAAAQAFLQSMPQYTHDSDRFGPDLYPAVRMEALRTMREVENMAITKLHEEPSMSLSMSLEDFGVGNITKFRDAARRMVDFVLRDAPKGCSIKKCMSPDKFVENVVQASFLDPSVVAKPPPSSSKRTTVTHVTQGLMSKEVQLEYISRLKRDPVLGAYLVMLADIINTPTPTDGKPLIDKYPKVVLPSRLPTV